MKKLVQDVFMVSYLKNVGARRLCLVLGVLLALVPACLFATKLYVSEHTNLRDAVVFGSTKQQRLIFKNYPYKCNFCDLETDFERWRSKFGSWKHTKDLQNTDCSRLRDSASCYSARKYLAQKVKVSYFDFAAFAYLIYAFLLFYVPFVLACAVQWILDGFKQNESVKKKK